MNVLTDQIQKEQVINHITQLLDQNVVVGRSVVALHIAFEDELQWLTVCLFVRGILGSIGPIHDLSHRSLHATSSGQLKRTLREHGVPLTIVHDQQPLEH